MIKNWLAPGAIIVLTFLFILLWDSPPQNFLELLPGTPPKEAQFPSNILFNAVNRHYDDEGQLSSEFTASESRYFQVNPKKRTARDYADLTKPSLTLHSTSAPPWYITADTGKAKNNGELIQLWGDVHIWQIDAQGQKQELTTPYLVVKPKDQYAETDKPVMITSPGNQTQAVGMKAFLEDDTIKLLSNVRGVHKP